MTGARFQRLCVLIVDDNQNMRELMRAILQALGVVQIVEGRDCDHAIQKIRDFTVDLVITDWVMEPRDGIDLTNWIRTDSESPDPFMPVIMVSGHTEKDRITAARDAGVTEFMAKPISAKAVLQRLVAVIESPRPFVRTRSYFGPDRRRKNEPFSGEDRRRKPSDTMEAPRAMGAGGGS
jgi:two-component system chemotaxis response regulator CheY